MAEANLLASQFKARRASDGAPERSRWRAAAFLEFLPAIIVGVLVQVVGAPRSGATLEGLLAAIAILTGFAFALALQAWKSSLDGRRDASYAFDLSALGLLDQMRDRLLWASLSGVTTTAWLAAVQVFGADRPARWALAIGSALFAYALVMVMAALWQLYRAAQMLR